MKILVVVDMQNDFVSGSLGTPEAQAIVPVVKAKIAEYQANGDIIIYTRDTHFSNYLATPEGNKLPVEHCIQDTWGWQVVEELKEFWEPRWRITKARFGHIDLYGTILRCMPNDWKVGVDPITEIELIGFCTDICVVSNALILKASVDNDTVISCDASCCAGTSIETHEAALKVMQTCQVEVINEGC